MHSTILSMLERYECITQADYENALKEIMQEVALLGLWRAKFYEHVAFYGGTALRILYGLDRFSEDLDFSLLEARKEFELSPYLKAVAAELRGFGFSVSIEEGKKTKDSSIESAFIKAGTKEHLIRINVPEVVADRIQKNMMMTIKLEVDTDPPGGFHTEAKTLLQPIPFSVNTYQRPDLFAGKIHAILQRSWKGRVKGRDYYDFIWYLGNRIPVNLSHLEQRLRQSGGWTGENSLKIEDLGNLLKEKFSSLDIAAAKKDVAPFIRDSAALELWTKKFFVELIPRIKTI